MLTADGYSYWAPIEEAEQAYKAELFPPWDQGDADGPAEQARTHEQRPPVKRERFRRLRKLLRHGPAERQPPTLAELTPLDTLMAALGEPGEDTPTAPNEPSEDKSKE